MDILSAILDLALGAAAFRLAWSVDRSQKTLAAAHQIMAKLLEELTQRVERLEEKIK